MNASNSIEMQRKAGLLSKNLVLNMRHALAQENLSYNPGRTLRNNQEEYRRQFAEYRPVRSSIRPEPSSHNEKIARSFFENAHELELRGSEEQALDLVYDAIDELLRNSRFEQLDSILKSSNFKKYSIDILLAVLTATYPAKSKLPSRGTLYQNTKEVIDSSGEDSESLLAGLQD